MCPRRKCIQFPVPLALIKALIIDIILGVSASDYLWWQVISQMYICETMQSIFCWIFLCIHLFPFWELVDATFWASYAQSVTSVVICNALLLHRLCSGERKILSDREGSPCDFKIFCFLVCFCVSLCVIIFVFVRWL